MYILEKSEEFDTWLRKLKDLKAKAKILAKLKRAELGNLGNHKYIGNGLSEMIIDYGPGYRLYYTKRRNILLILLVGGDKSSQSRNIAKAKIAIKNLEVKNENKS